MGIAVFAQGPYEDRVNTGIGTFLFNPRPKNDLRIFPVLIKIFLFGKKIMMDTSLVNIVLKFGGCIFMENLGKNL